MRYTMSPVLPALLGVALMVLGYCLWRSGGRPMLFGGLLLFGAGGTALLLALGLALPDGRGMPLIRLLMALVAAAVLSELALLGVVLCGRSSRITAQPQTVVVLGANLWDHKPSPILMERLECAAAYLNEHPDTRVVVTGGMGDDEPVSEASCMAQALEARGVAAERILLEDAARNTYENLKFTKRLLEDRGLSTQGLLVVSSDAHLARTRLLARRVGLDIDTLAAPMSGALTYRCYFCLRESAALVKSFLMDRG